MTFQVDPSRVADDAAAVGAALDTRPTSPPRLRHLPRRGAAAIPLKAGAGPHPSNENGMRRTIVAVGFGSVLLGFAPAGAAVPQPTLSVRMTVHDETTAAPLTRGRWVVTEPGKSATLKVDGLNPVDGRTTVVGVWTSHVFRPGRGVAVRAQWAVDEAGVAVQVRGGNWQVQSRSRHGSSTWSAWEGSKRGFTAMPGGITLGSIAGEWWAEFPQPPRDRWQFQLRIRYTVTAVARHASSIVVTTTR
jgi:hypothetical protein